MDELEAKWDSTNTKKFARKKMPAASSVSVSCGYSAGGTGLVYGSCNKGELTSEREREKDFSATALCLKSLSA